MRKKYALFADGSCCTVGKHQRWNIALYGVLGLTGSSLDYSCFGQRTWVHTVGNMEG